MNAWYGIQEKTSSVVGHQNTKKKKSALREVLICPSVVTYSLAGKGIYGRNLQLFLEVTYTLHQDLLQKIW